MYPQLNDPIEEVRSNPFLDEKAHAIKQVVLQSCLGPQCGCIVPGDTLEPISWKVNAQEEGKFVIDHGTYLAIHSKIEKEFIEVLYTC